MRLKLVLLLFAPLMFLYSTAYSQIRLIAKTGVSITNYRSEFFFPSRFNTTPEMGITAGVGLDMPFSKRVQWLSLLAELNYEQRRFSTNLASSDMSLNYTSSLHYLEVPMLLKATASKSNFIGYVNIGPSISYAMLGTQKANFVYQGTPSITESAFNFERANKLDYAMNFGAGLGVKLGYGVLQVDARYKYGFNNLTSNYRFCTTYTHSENSWTEICMIFPDDQKSSILTFTLGYSMPLVR